MERDIKFEFILKDECIGGYAFGRLTYSLDELLELGISNDDIIEKATDQFSPANGMDSEFEIIAKRQYTGLEDKNGVEIYEGDVVKCSYGIGYIDYTESYFRIFRPYVFSTNLCNETTKNTLLGENTVVVIGNIYENPELLEEEK